MTAIVWSMRGSDRTYYYDGDHDTFGCDPSLTSTCSMATRVDCAAPDGYVSNHDDCDDSPTGASINPAAVEVCDGTDNDCDTIVDEGVTTSCWPDDDGDGFALADSAVALTCGTCADLEASSGMFYTSQDPAAVSDCDDTDSSVFPLQAETCNGTDDDCDGTVDEEPTDLGTRPNCSACGDVCQFACSSGSCDLAAGVSIDGDGTCAYTEQGTLFCWGGTRTVLLVMVRRPLEIVRCKSRFPPVCPSWSLISMAGILCAGWRWCPRALVLGPE